MSKQNVRSLGVIRLATESGFIHYYDGFRINVVVRGDLLLYSVTVCSMKRRKDGTVGRRRGPILTTGVYASPDHAIDDAANWLLRAYPELKP